jgi:hypothetical protein
MRALVGGLWSLRGFVSREQQRRREISYRWWCAVVVLHCAYGRACGSQAKCGERRGVDVVDDDDLASSSIYESRRSCRYAGAGHSKGLAVEIQFRAVYIIQGRGVQFIFAISTSSRQLEQLSRSSSVVHARFNNNNRSSSIQSNKHHKGHPSRRHSIRDHLPSSHLVVFPG